MSDDAQFEALTAADLDLPSDARLPIRFRAGRVWSPLVISFPHVGLAWPHDLRPKPQADFARNADYEVQRLYAAAADAGAATVEALYSRLVVDLNRASDDVSTVLVPDHPAPRPRQRPGAPMSDASGDHGHRLDRPGRGVVWASAVGAGSAGPVRILDGPLSYPAFQDRIRRFHAPYHRALELLLERRRERFGYAILLDAHSMPGTVGADLVLGTLAGESCGAAVQSVALGALGAREGSSALRVKVNEPYRGGELIRRHGRPAHGLHALQLEVNRSLYMDERSTMLWVTGADAHLGPQPATSSGTNPGTEPTGARETSSGPPTPRQARDLAELVRRVTCLIRRLAEVSDRLRCGHPQPTGART